MHRFILWFGVILLVSLFFPLRVSASVVINEIFANPSNEDDEFIELFNNSDSEVDLSNWKVKDLVKSYAIIDLKIGPKSFLVLDKNLTGIALNNSDEEVSIVDLADSIIDAFNYSETIEDRTWSRSPDGTGSFSNGTNITKGLSNALPPTSTPTPTPEPTSTPKPTKEPTSTKIPTVKPTEKVEPIKKDTPKPEVKREKKMNLVTTPHTQDVKGESDINNADLEQPVENKIDGSPPMYLYSITTGVGMIILACGILLYRKFKKKNDEDGF